MNREISPLNILIAGVGGQGSILTSHLITQTALKQGLNVKLAETFGAATRGGSVMAHIRIGEVWAPQMAEDEADYMIALEPLEGLRVAITYIKPGGWIVFNTRPWLPVDVNTGRAVYPSISDIETTLKDLEANVIRFDATETAIQAGDPRSLNSVLLGSMFSLKNFPLDEELLFQAMAERWPEKLVIMNKRAFMMGKQAVTLFV